MEKQENIGAQIEHMGRGEAMTRVQAAASAHLQGLEERVSRCLAQPPDAVALCVWPMLRQIVAALRGMEARLTALEAGEGR